MPSRDGGTGSGPPPIAVTRTSGTSQRSIFPSPLSSVKLPTSGKTQLPSSGPPVGPFHVHLVVGVNAFGGADFVHSRPPPLSSEGGTLHLSMIGVESGFASPKTGGGTTESVV